MRSLVTLAAAFGLVALAACGSKTPASTGGGTSSGGSGSGSGASSSGTGGATTASSSGSSASSSGAGGSSSSGASTSSSSGASTSSSSGAPVCTGTQVVCAGACVDVGTDTHDCGACGHDCLGASCSAGQCAATSVIVAPGIGLIAVDATDLFYVASFDIDRVPLAGGTPTKINMPDGVIGLAAQAFVLDAGNVFWTSAASPDTGYVVSVTKGGSGQKELVNQLANFGKPYALAPLLGPGGAAQAIIWVSYGDGQSTDHPIVVKTTTGGTSQAIGLLPTLFGDGVALDATSAYVTSPDGGNVYKVPLAGGTPVVFAGGLTAPEQIVADTQNLYVLDFGTAVGANLPDCSIVSIPLAGGPSVTLAAHLPNLGQIAVGGGYVYATSRYTASSSTADGAVLAVPIAGGAPVTLVSGQPSPGAIAVDATYVYWANAGLGGSPGGVWKVPR